MIRVRRAVVVLLALASIAPAAVGAATRQHSLGTFSSWNAVTFGGRSSLSCMIWSQPTGRSGKGKRADAFVFVTHRPREKWINRVTVETGYTVKHATRVSVTVGSRHFVLAAGGTAAWTHGAKEDAALIAAMRAGREMSVEGTAKSGRRMRDRYSLTGFTAAYRAIGKACGVK